MAQMEKSKLMAFAKKTANPPSAATALAQKRMAAKAPPPAGAPAPHGEPHAEAPHMGEGQEEQVDLFELVEEAATAAEAGQDIDLEDIVAGTKSTGPQDAPAWAEDPAKWAEAAEAVGLGIPGTEDKYEEPVIVAAYLYKMLQGPVKGLEIPAPPAVPEGEGPTDMAKPGAAAKALQARGAGKPPPHAAQAPRAPLAAPGAAKPSEGKPGAPEAGPEDELKKMVDAAAASAQMNPDPSLTQKLQTEPPQEGMAPSWAADGDKWTKAESAVKPHWTEYPEPFLVVGHIYLAMGGGVV